jgi:hypothetical protein
VDGLGASDDMIIGNDKTIRTDYPAGTGAGLGDCVTEEILSQRLGVNSNNGWFHTGDNIGNTRQGL